MPRRLAVLAGSGTLAPEVIGAALRLGDTVRVLALAEQRYPGEVNSTDFVASSPEPILDAIRDFRSSHIVLAGAVNLDDAARRNWAAALGGGAGNDVALSKAAASLARLTGAEVIGAHQIVPDLLAPQGEIAGPPATPDQLEAGRAAIAFARRVGELDLGQAVVVAGQRLLAAEDLAGTDALLARLEEYRRRGLVRGMDLLLAKARKPEQPVFVDLPAIGAATVRNCAAAGISAIAVEAGQTLLLERPEMIDAANSLGVSVFGLPDDG